MSAIAPRLTAFLAEAGETALVEVTGAKGSTPRERGAWMLVSRAVIFGTIGGGQLEYMAIDKARQMLAGGLRGRETLSVPLGPEIGQCCGGRVEVSVCLVDASIASQLADAAADTDARRPHVYVFGGGHVGHALAASLSLLPVRVIVVETRAEELGGLPETVEKRLTPVPEEEVRQAPEGSAFFILTHDHALDFLIVAEALRRDDAGYVGMIGSKTKRATFRSWYLKSAAGGDDALRRLVCPIGGDAVKDKRPEVIAALAAAEVIAALASPSTISARPATGQAARG